MQADDVQDLCFYSNDSSMQHYSHKKEASADMVGNGTHPDVAVFL